MYDLSIKFNQKFSKAYNNKSQIYLIIGYALRLLSRNLEAIQMYDLALILQP